MIKIVGQKMEHINRAVFQSQKIALQTLTPGWYRIILFISSKSVSAVDYIPDYTLVIIYLGCLV